jgi:hypothetical protein
MNYAISATLRIFFPRSLAAFFSYLIRNPSHNQSHNKIDLFFIERPVLLDSMPF